MQLRGIQVQLLTDTILTIDDGDPLIFNTIVNDQSLNINYSTVTGQFTITAPGNYFVTWWVDTDGAGAALQVSFGVSLNGGAANIGASPIVTGQVTGTALLSVGAVPATVELVNATGDVVFIPTITPVQANMIITEVSL